MKIAVTATPDEVKKLLLKRYDAVALSQIGRQCVVFFKDGKKAYEIFSVFGGKELYQTGKGRKRKPSEVRFECQVNSLIPRWRSVGHEVDDHRPLP